MYQTESAAGTTAQAGTGRITVGLSGGEYLDAAARVPQSKRVRVLLIAEAANPEFVSVPLVGWSHCQAIRRVCDAHLVTQVRNREAVRRAGLVEGKDFTAIDSELFTRTAWRVGTLLGGGRGKGWTAVTAVYSIAYYQFEHLVWGRFGGRIRAGEFDVVHRVTPLSPALPSIIAGRCRRAGVPFVVGPLNGGLPWPKEFGAARREEREWLSYVRGAYKLLPGYRSTRRNAAAIVVGSRDTMAQVPARYADKCVYVPENAVDPARFPVTRARRASKPLRLVFVGRLVPYKGADMLIEAATPLVRRGDVTADIIGDGPQMPRLKAIVDRLGSSGAVRLSGWVAHQDVAARLCDADLFVLPSIREFGGGVVLEAMAVGLVPVVVNYGGPAELVTDRTGFRIAMGTRGQIVERLGSLLARLVENPGEIESRSAAAMRRVRELYTWDAKALQMMQVYHWVLGWRRTKPAFSAPFADADDAFPSPRPTAAVGLGVATSSSSSGRA